MTNPTPTPEPLHINASRALRMIQDAVKTRSPEYNYKQDPERFPDGVSSACVYVRNGVADCLVGVALVLEGVPVRALEMIEAESYDLDNDEEHDCTVEGCVSAGDHATSVSNSWFLERLRELTGVTMTTEAVYVFSSAQVYQDTARTWGEAEAAAAKAKEQGFAQPLPNALS